MKAKLFNILSNAVQFTVFSIMLLGIVAVAMVFFNAHVF